MNFQIFQFPLKVFPGVLGKEVRNFKRFGDVGPNGTLDPHGSPGVPLCKVREVIELIVYAPHTGIYAIILALVGQP